MNLPRTRLPANYQAAPDLLGGRVILVTGAGQGLGKVAAHAFARHGATVILHGRNVAKLEKTYDEIIADGFLQPAILPLDFAKTTQTELVAFGQSIHATLGRLDGIFHAANHFVGTMPMASHDLDCWQLHAKVNLAVPAALCKACWPLLTRAPAASIVFLTESHADVPVAYWGPFAVTRNALAALVAVWTDELAADANLRINLCLPGPVNSPMRSKSHPGELASSLPAAESLAQHFLYMIGPDAAHMRGQVLDCRQAISVLPSGKG